MNYLDLTFPTPAENLACDEALLNFCEENDDVENILRVWQPSDTFVVVGYANKVKSEVNVDACQAKGVPILRRCSGGGTVVQGAGCLNYSLILNFAGNESLQTITSANQFIMERHRELFQTRFHEGVQIEGHTDLAIFGVKFSGNAQRRKKKCLLFHGTFLLNFDLILIQQLLRMPTHQPNYRNNRSHEEFVKNVSIAPDLLKGCLRDVWNATALMESEPGLSEDLVTKYQSNEWNFKF